MARYLLLICLFLPICANALPIQGNFVVDMDLTIEPGHYQLDSFVINQGATLSFLPDFDVETVVFEVRDHIEIFGSMILGNYDLTLSGTGLFLGPGSDIDASRVSMILTSEKWGVTPSFITPPSQRATSMDKGLVIISGPLQRSYTEVPALDFISRSVGPALGGAISMPVLLTTPIIISECCNSFIIPMNPNITLIAIDPSQFQTVSAPSSILLTLLGLCTLFIARYWQPILKS